MSNLRHGVQSSKDLKGTALKQGAAFLHAQLDS